MTERTEVLSDDRCPSCGSKWQGLYCAQCGEKRLDPHELTLAHFVTSVISGLLHIEGKFWKSLGWLAAAPGRLTLDYLEGRRVQTLKPAKLFITINIIYFFVQPFSGVQVFSMDLEHYMHYQSHSKWISGIVERQVVRKHVAFPEYEARFDALSATFAKSLVVLFIPLMAVGSAFIYRRASRPAVAHVVHATHFMAFTLLYVCCVLLPLAKSIALTLGLNFELWRELLERIGLVVVIVLLIGYSFKAGQRVFGGSKWLGLGQASAFGVWFVLCLYVYRVLLLGAVYLWA